LPATTIVSIGHRTTLTSLHRRNVALAAEGGTFTLTEDREEIISSAPAKAGGAGGGARRKQAE